MKRYSMLTKTLCFFLAVFAALGSVGFLLVAFGLSACGLYSTGPEPILRDYYRSYCDGAAYSVSGFYADSTLQDSQREGYISYNGERYGDYSGATNYRYQLYDAEGTLLKSTYGGEAAAYASDELVDVYEWVYANSSYGEEEESRLVATYRVKGYILQELTFSDQISFLNWVLRLGTTWRYGILFLGIASVLLFAAALVYLHCAAGHRVDQEGICLNYLDRIPLDLYFGVAAGLAAGIVLLLVFLWDELFRQVDAQWPFLLTMTLLGGGVCVAIALGWWLSFITRIKYGGGCWWRRSVMGWVLLLCLRALRWCWNLMGRMYGGLLRFLQIIPTVALWLVVGFGVWVLVLFMAGTRMMEEVPGLFLLLSLLLAALVCYIAASLGRIKEGIAKMAQGDLEEKLDEAHLHGTFRTMAQGLNRLGDGVRAAVERQMRSERMKTELITNVSHDIKTPLTSIINYVDLLQKPHTSQEQDQYLEVLDRQSKRLKKLTEDLVELSKANSGNLPVQLAPTNVVELVNQALAEYQTKLAKANLTPIFTPRSEEAIALADGRLFWRILDNLLGNAVKYAQPGTRLYVDLELQGRDVVISVKNVSRERLNISSEELMERFVRGDASRNTEGSGLGLNIAKTLAELQGATLELVIDGDLFKAVLRFPSAAE